MLRRRPSRAALEQELHAARLSAQMTEARLLNLMRADKYQAGLHDGVTVGIRQLRQWLSDSRDQAWRTIADLGDHANSDWNRGHDFAAAWIDEAIFKLDQELEGRAHAEVAAGHQEQA